MNTPATLTAAPGKVMRGDPPGRFATIGGHRIHYERFGPHSQAPPILLIHGFLESTACFAKVIPALARQREVLAIDLPGYGFSDRPATAPYTVEWFADEVRRFLDALRIPRVVMVGHSMGGAVALVLAGKYPRWVDRLVAVDSACYPVSLPLLGRLALLPGIGPVLFKKGYRKSDLEKLWKREVFFDPEVLTPERIDLVWSHISAPGGKEAAYRSLCDLSRRERIAFWIPRIMAPTLIVWGKEERLHPIDHAHRLAAEIPGAKLALLEACGHHPVEEQPEAFLEALLPFLEG